MRTKAFITAVRLARNLCMSQSRLSSTVWELVVAPASAVRSCILAFDARRSGGTVSVGQLDGNERSSRKACVDADFRVLQFFQPDCHFSSQVSACCAGRISFAARATTQSSSGNICSPSDTLSHICRAAMASYIHDMLQRKCILLKTRQTLKLFYLACGPARA
jgi:hypothetical protein